MPVMDQFAIVTLTDPRTGRSFAGNIPLHSEWNDMRPPMSLGLTPKPEEYNDVFSVIAPSVPAWCNVFSPPGSGLPKFTSKAIADLPPGTLPWIHHKDKIPLASMIAYAHDLQERYKVPTGRKIRWTFSHEKAPAPKSEREQYFKDWEDVVRVGEECPWIEPVQIQTDYAMRRRRDTRARDWIIPGVSLAFNCYVSRFGKGSPYECPESTFALLIALAREFGVPAFGVSEFGADTVDGTPAERALALMDGVSYLDRQGASFVGLWASHEVRGGITYDYRPNDEPTRLAFRTIFGSDQ